MGLGRPDEGAAGLDRGALLQVVVEDPAADPVAGLDQQHGAAVVGDLAGRDQPGDAAADDDDVDVAGEGALQAGGRRLGQGPGAERQAPERGAAEQGATGELGHHGLRYVNVCQIRVLTLL